MPILKATLIVEDFSVKLYTEVAKRITRAMFRAKPEIEKGMRSIVFEYISRSPECLALKGNTTLRGALGIGGGGDLSPKIDVDEAIDQIIQAVADSLELVVVPVVYTGGGFTGGIEIGVVRQDLQEVLDLPIASFISEGKNRGQVDWLKWLLTSGSSIVITGYHFTRSHNAGGSRTGIGIMARRGNFAVPSNIGTNDNNFLTRALDSIEPEIAALLEKSIGVSF